MGQQLRYLLIGTLLTLLLQLAAGLLGPFGLLFNFFVPFPAAFTGMRRGAALAGGVVMLTAAALLGMGEAAGAAVYFLQFGLGSWMLPLLLRRRWPWDRTVAAILLTLTVVSGLTLTAFAATHQEPVGAVVERYLQGERARAMAIYRQAGASPEQESELQTITEQVASFLVRAWPGLGVVGTGVLLLLTLFFLAIAAKERYTVPGPSFRLWKAPENLVWLLIAAGAAQLLSGGVLKQTGLNVLLVIMPVYFLQGLAIVHYYFRKRNVSPLFSSLSYLMITVLNPLPLVVTGVGVFDLWVDFRKPRITRT